MKPVNENDRGARVIDILRASQSLPATRDPSPCHSSANSPKALPSTRKARRGLTVEVDECSLRFDNESTTGERPGSFRHDEDPASEEENDGGKPLFISIADASEPEGDPFVPEHHDSGGGGMGKQTESSRGRRQRIDKVLDDFLFISGSRAARNAKLTAEKGISAFLCVAANEQLPTVAAVNEAENRTAAGAPVAGASVVKDDAAPASVLMKHVPMADDGRTDLQGHFDECFSFLQRCRSEGRRVLVYCREGKSRSASIVIGFLIRFYDMSYDSALEFLRAARDEVDPNFAFCTQLDSFSQQERDRRLVSSSSQTNSFESPLKTASIPNPPRRVPAGSRAPIVSVIPLSPTRLRTAGAPANDCGAHAEDSTSSGGGMLSPHTIELCARSVTIPRAADGGDGVAATTKRVTGSSNGDSSSLFPSMPTPKLGPSE